jgi:hypothetical protein
MASNKLIGTGLPNPVLHFHNLASPSILMSLPYFTAWLLLNVLTSIEEHKQSLSHHFELNEIGNLSYILGLEASSSNDDYYLSQENYAFNLLSLGTH